MQTPRPPRLQTGFLVVARLILRHEDLNTKLTNVLKERNHKIFLIRRNGRKRRKEAAIGSSGPSES